MWICLPWDGASQGRAMKLGWQQDRRCQNTVDETPEHAETATKKDCKAKEGTTGFSNFGENQSIMSALVWGRGFGEWKVVALWLYFYFAITWRPSKIKPSCEVKPISFRSLEGSCLLQVSRRCGGPGWSELEGPALEGSDVEHLLVPDICTALAKKSVTQI